VIVKGRDRKPFVLALQGVFGSCHPASESSEKTSEHGYESALHSLNRHALGSFSSLVHTSADPREIAGVLRPSNTREVW